MNIDVSLADLRLQLKAWEKSFAAANGGRKPGRDDIKQEPVIGEHIFEPLAVLRC